MSTTSHDLDAYVVGTEDLEAIATEVWTAFLLEDGEPLYPVPPTARTHDAEVVHASVSVQGAWSGQVVIEVAPTAALRAARAMLALDDPTDADVTDAVGELVNMVGGNVKSVMPAPSTLGLPMVVQGRVTRSAAYDAEEVCSTELAWAGESVRFSVWASARNEEMQAR